MMLPLCQSTSSKGLLETSLLLGKKTHSKPPPPVHQPGRETGSGSVPAGCRSPQRRPPASPEAAPLHRVPQHPQQLREPCTPKLQTPLSRHAGGTSPKYTHLPPAQQALTGTPNPSRAGDSPAAEPRASTQRRQKQTVARNTLIPITPLLSVRSSGAEKFR